MLWLTVPLAHATRACAHRDGSFTMGKGKLGKVSQAHLESAGMQRVPGRANTLHPARGLKSEKQRHMQSTLELCTKSN